MQETYTFKEEQTSILALLARKVGWENRYTQSLNQLDDLIANFVADGCQHITNINGVTFQFSTLDELLKLRQTLKGLSDVTNQRAGLQKPMQRIKMRLFV